MVDESSLLEIDIVDIMPAKCCFRSSIILEVDEPDTLGPSFYLPEGETLEVPENSGYHFRTLNGWCKALFYQQGSITGPVVLSKIDSIETAGDLYLRLRGHLREIFTFTFGLLSLPLLVLTIFGIEEANKVDARSIDIISSHICLSVTVIWIIAAVANFVSLAKLKNSNGRAAIEKLNDLVEGKTFFKAWLPEYLIKPAK